MLKTFSNRSITVIFNIFTVIHYNKMHKFYLYLIKFICHFYNRSDWILVIYFFVLFIYSFIFLLPFFSHFFLPVFSSEHFKYVIEIRIQRYKDMKMLNFTNWMKAKGKKHDYFWDFFVFNTPDNKVERNIVQRKKKEKK